MIDVPSFARSKRPRRQGLRLIDIWVPDVRSPAFAAEAHRQSLLVAESASEVEDQGWIDTVSAAALHHGWGAARPESPPAPED